MARQVRTRCRDVLLDAALAECAPADGIAMLADGSCSSVACASRHAAAALCTIPPEARRAALPRLLRALHAAASSAGASGATAGEDAAFVLGQWAGAWAARGDGGKPGAGFGGVTTICSPHPVR